jgi:Zn-finger nucleic acid-binding protein
MSHRDGVEIDYCPKCRGVWLDRGELEKILERSGSRFDDRGFDTYRDDRRNRDDDDFDDRRRGGRRDGFLDNIFDIFH